MAFDMIIDRIYEAAFVPDGWGDVLEQTGALSGSLGGAVFSYSAGIPLRGRTVPALMPLLDEFISSDMGRSCIGAVRMLDMQPACFVAVDDYLSGDEIERDPIRIRLRELGLEAGLCTAIPLPSGEIVTFIYHRAAAKTSYEDGEIDALNRLRPHLARASLMAARLGLEEARSTVTALERLGLPAAVLNAHGRVVAANTLLAALPDVFIPRAHGGMSLAAGAADALLQAALAELGSRTHAAVRSIPIAATEIRSAMVLHAVPLRRAARDIFTGGDVLIAACDVRLSETGPPVELLRGLFDLSPAEARIAAALTRGLTLQEAAAQQAITVKTARSYLEQAFRKTGTVQQSQLVALLAGTLWPREALPSSSPSPTALQREKGKARRGLRFTRNTADRHCR